MKKIFGAKRKPIAESEVLFAGTARNVANFIDAEVQSLASNLKQFKKVYGLIIESDSSDDTIGKLEELKAKNPNITYISLGNLSQKMPKRTERLAFCRNRIVHELRTNTHYSRVDYIALADLDSVNGELTPEKIAQCWTVKEDWDVITANQGDIITIYGHFAIQSGVEGIAWSKCGTSVSCLMKRPVTILRSGQKWFTSMLTRV